MFLLSEVKMYILGCMFLINEGSYVWIFTLVLLRQLNAFVELGDLE